MENNGNGHRRISIYYKDVMLDGTIRIVPKRGIFISEDAHSIRFINHKGIEEGIGKACIARFEFDPI